MSAYERSTVLLLLPAFCTCLAYELQTASHRWPHALQLRQNGQQQGESSAAEESQIWTGMAAAKSGFPWSMHVSMALVTVAAFLFFEQRDSSALIRKLVWSIVIPVGHSGSTYMVVGPLGKMTRVLCAWMPCGPEPHDQLSPLLCTCT